MGTTSARSWTTWAASLNPHARGDDASEELWAKLAAPQPPRTWGRRTGARYRQRTRASTPTHVGTTVGRPSDCDGVGLNPHARGDDPMMEMMTGAGIPQPPRTWGRRAAPCRPSGSGHLNPHARGDDVSLLAHHGGQVASTPTHVGTTPAQSSPTSTPGLNPHARGDDNLGGDAGKGNVPQPPRTWGRHPDCRQRRLGVASTPTHVGTTGWLLVVWRGWSLNPHARGDD